MRSNFLALFFLVSQSPCRKMIQPRINKPLFQCTFKPTQMTSTNLNLKHQHKIWSSIPCFPSLHYGFVGQLVPRSNVTTDSIPFKRNQKSLVTSMSGSNELHVYRVVFVLLSGVLNNMSRCQRVLNFY